MAEQQAGRPNRIDDLMAEAEQVPAAAEAFFFGSLALMFYWPLYRFAAPKTIDDCFQAACPRKRGSVPKGVTNSTRFSCERSKLQQHVNKIDVMLDLAQNSPPKV